MQFEIIPPYGLCDPINYSNVSEPECVQYSFITPVDPTNEYLAKVQMPPAPLDDLALTIFGVNGTNVLETVNFIPLDFNKTEYSSYNKTCILKNFPYTDTFNFAISATNGLNKEFTNSFNYAFESLCDKANTHANKLTTTTFSSIITLSISLSFCSIVSIIAVLGPKIAQYCKLAPKPDADRFNEPSITRSISLGNKDILGPSSPTEDAMV